jgi:hypothetical protein
MNLKIPTVDGRTRSGRIPQDVVDADSAKTVGFILGGNGMSSLINVQKLLPSWQIFSV